MDHKANRHRPIEVYLYDQMVIVFLEGIAWEVRQATLRTNNTGTACKGITCGGR